MACRGVGLDSGLTVRAGDCLRFGAVQAGLRQIDRLMAELDVLRRQLVVLSRRPPGCRALRAAWFGVGPVTAVGIWAELERGAPVR